MQVSTPTIWPLPSILRTKLAQIKQHAAAGEKHVYTLILTPRTSTLVNQILEEEGVLGEITISSYNLQFIPLEEDLLSLEHENAFKEIWAVSSRPLGAGDELDTKNLRIGRRWDCCVQFSAGSFDSSALVRLVSSDTR